MISKAQENIKVHRGISLMSMVKISTKISKDSPFSKPLGVGGGGSVRSVAKR